MADCIFCKIIKGEIPAHKVYEDKSVLAFLDIHPLNPGHIIITPKNHVDEWQDMSEDLFDHVMEAAQRLGRTLKIKLKPARVGFWVEGFEVAHAHIHVSPLQNANDFSTKRTKAEMQAEPDNNALAAIAKKLTE